MRDQLPPAQADRARQREEGAPPHEGAPSRPASRAWPHRFALPALVAAAAVALLGGCSDSGDGTASVSAKGTPPSVEKLGSALECKVKVTKKVEDYRLGSCKKDKTLFTMVTFKDNRAKRGWLDFSKPYGGTYLVGSRWLVLADSDKKLIPVQAKFGGTIEEGAAHGHGRS
ncbi:hypothetical protein ACFPA8_09200 [Streptomyces ovatisporus]|uniref:Lipoprotein n=1 Tax=Streptomyces ovatisporus TaxID=1128682 RepID=A0ABV9A321_9ACTN